MFQRFMNTLTSFLFIVIVSLCYPKDGFVTNKLKWVFFSIRLLFYDATQGKRILRSRLPADRKALKNHPNATDTRD